MNLGSPCPMAQEGMQNGKREKGKVKKEKKKGKGEKGKGKGKKENGKKGKTAETF